MFKIIEDLVQGSEEWHQRRNSGIGGTDAPVIMGENPWKSTKYLLEEKLGLRKRFEGNEHTRRGITLEPLARSAYEKITKIKLEPAVLQSNKLHWQFASTDGINVQKKKIIEIKCGTKAYEYTAANNIAPPYYYGQIQHILCVSGYKSLDFFCWLPDYEPVLVNIERDEEYITRLIKEEFKFYQLMQDRKLDSSEPEKSKNLYSQQQTTYNFQYNYSSLNQSTISSSASSPDKKGVQISLKNTEEIKSEPLSKKSEIIKLNENLPKIFLNGASYSGDLKDGLMHGFGTLSSKDGEFIYSGDFKNGLFAGFGTFITRDGNVYTGDWAIDQQEIDPMIQFLVNKGVATFLIRWFIKSAVWTDFKGNKYSGDLTTHDFMIFNFQGYGRYEWYEGTKYQGFFVNGIREGEGKFTSFEGKEYKGIWSRGVLEAELLEEAKYLTQDIHSYFKKLNSLKDEISTFELKWKDFDPKGAFKERIVHKLFRGTGTKIEKYPTSIFLEWLKSARKLTKSLDDGLSEYLSVRDSNLPDMEVGAYCCFEDGYRHIANQRVIENIKYLEVFSDELFVYYEKCYALIEQFDHIK